MVIKLTVHCNEDDALIAWRPEGAWPDAWVGFVVEKRNVKTGEVTTLNNRIPASVGEGLTPAAGVSSLTSPFRRCMWTDHQVAPSDNLQYRVTPMVTDGASFVAAPEGPSEWTSPTVIEDADANGLSVHFNRGTLMSQIVSRFVNNDVTTASLARFKAQLATPGFPPRRYLSGHAREALLGFLADADRRGSRIFGAIYEFNDEEIIAAVMAFGKRGAILLGNGDAMKHGLADELAGAGLEVHERDLSKRGASSPSVHNKFVVEVTSTGDAVRVLTGSLNWTVTGLCTQLNNTIIVERPSIAARFLQQWHALVAAGDDMPPELKAANAAWTSDGPVSLGFAATPNEEEFTPVLKALDAARDAIFFLMFMPGESPLLKSALTQSAKADGPFVRGIVSTVRQSASGTITAQGARVVMDGVTQSFDDDVLTPEAVSENDRPTWAYDEFTRKAFFAAKLMAIVHSKVIVIDPFSDNCVVVTGSHNFSDSASQKNDENIVVIKGDRALAQAYAVHIQGVYDSYAWRAFLDNDGDPNTIYQGLENWKPGGSHARELDFWVDAK